MTIANLLTLIRLGCAPALVFADMGERAGAPAFLAFAVVAVAALTDFFDGLAARRLNQVSRLGAIIDPIADKVLVLTALFLLQRDLADGALLWPTLIILWREMAISGFREAFAVNGEALSVSKLAKWKTAVQFAALLFLYGARAFAPFKEFFSTAGVLILWLAAAITFYTGVGYMLRLRLHSWK